MSSATSTAKQRGGGMGLYDLLSLPAFYRWSQNITWRQSGAEFLIGYGQPVAGEKVLDIGCGPGNRFSELPEVQYTGFDLSQEYIDEARRRHGSRARFFCGDVGSVGLDSEKATYDLVLAYGVLHHVDDERASRL